MKKNKEWLKEEINKTMETASYKGIFYSPRMSRILYDDLIKVVDQLDEPEKVVIPKFVADWIEREDDPIFEICACYEMYGRNGRDGEVEFTKELANWFDDNAEKFYEACVNGYTIEQPKLLTVIVKDYDETLHRQQVPKEVANEIVKLLQSTQREVVE